MLYKPGAEMHLIRGSARPGFCLLCLQEPSTRLTPRRGPGAGRGLLDALPRLRAQDGQESWASLPPEPQQPGGGIHPQATFAGWRVVLTAGAPQSPQASSPVSNSDRGRRIQQMPGHHQGWGGGCGFRASQTLAMFPGMCINPIHPGWSGGISRPGPFPELGLVRPVFLIFTAP